MVDVDTTEVDAASARIKFYMNLSNTSSATDRRRRGERSSSLSRSSSMKGFDKFVRFMSDSCEPSWRSALMERVMQKATIMMVSRRTWDDCVSVRSVLSGQAKQIARGLVDAHPCDCGASPFVDACRRNIEQLAAYAPRLQVDDDLWLIASAAAELQEDDVLLRAIVALVLRDADMRRIWDACVGSACSRFSSRGFAVAFITAA